jgi:signal-transduction protein with cAMP-binding, CBS, and nucleotidyltransferase domain
VIWQRAKTQSNSVYADVDGVGRYLIRWLTLDQEYRAFLNGKRTTYAAKTVREVQAMVERVQASIEQFNREHEHDVPITELVEPTLDGLARKCAELERRVAELEEKYGNGQA